MYFTNTPSLNSMEAIMKRPPGGIQRGGGRKRKPYQYTKADCSCRLCPHYQGKKRLCRFRLSGAGHPAGMRRRLFRGSRPIHVSGGEAPSLPTAASKNIQRKAR